MQGHKWLYKHHLVSISAPFAMSLTQKIHLLLFHFIWKNHNCLDDSLLGNRLRYIFEIQCYKMYKLNHHVILYKNDLFSLKKNLFFIVRKQRNCFILPLSCFYINFIGVILYGYFACGQCS